MFTTGSKFFFGLSLFGLVLAAAYGIATAGTTLSLVTFIGVATLGYKGGVGEHVGYTLLVGLAGASAFMGCVVAAFRDADARSQAELVDAERPPAAAAPQGASYWPIVAAFAVATLALGLVVSSTLFVLGLVALLVVLVEWMVKAWSERATGDPEANRAVRNRIMNPVEIPGIALIGIALVVLAFSRVLLALPKTGSTVIAIAVPALILAVGATIATRPRVGSTLVAVVCLLGGIGLLAGGVIGAAVGEREFEDHSGEEAEETDEAQEPAEPETPAGADDEAPSPTGAGG